MVDSVTIKIDDKEFAFWENVRMERAIDSLSAIDFSGPWHAGVMKDVFVPMSFKPLSLDVDGEPFFNGTLVNSDEPLLDSKVFTAGGYSRPGVLDDCPSPNGTPREFKGQNLQDITDTLIAPWGLESDFLNEDPGAVFKKYQRSRSEKVLQSIVGLAKQRNFIVGDDAEGKLIFRREIILPVPVAQLEQGKTLLSATPSFKPQEFYSSVEGVKKVKPRSKKTEKFVVQNPHMSGIVRPYTYSVPDVDGGDIEVAVNCKMGRMVAGAVNYDLVVPTWRDELDALWEENTTVKVKAPDARIYDWYTFLIKSVVFHRTPEKKHAILRVTLPGAFSGVMPEVLPWQT